MQILRFLLSAVAIARERRSGSTTAQAVAPSAFVQMLMKHGFVPTLSRSFSPRSLPESKHDSLLSSIGFLLVASP